MSVTPVKPKAIGPTAPASTAKWAKFWRVTQRTVQRWSKKRDMPRVEDVASMIRWAAGPERKPPTFLARVAELRLQQARGGTPAEDPRPHAPEPPPAAPSFSDPDWQEFHAAGTPSADPTKQLKTLELFRDYYSFKLTKANQLNDEHAIRNFSDLVIKYEKAIRDNKLAADKLGIESGDLLPRTEHEAIISAHAFWSMRAIDAALDRVTPRLLNLSFPEEARAVLEPVMLSARFFDPIIHSARTAARNALPGWFIDRHMEVVDDYLENGRALAQAELSPHLPPAFVDGAGI